MKFFTAFFAVFALIAIVYCSHVDKETDALAAVEKDHSMREDQIDNSEFAIDDSEKYSKHGKGKYGSYYGGKGKGYYGKGKGYYGKGKGYYGQGKGYYGKGKGYYGKGYYGKGKGYYGKGKGYYGNGKGYYGKGYYGKGNSKGYGKKYGKGKW